MNSIRLQFITQATDTYSHADSAALALEGGCRWIQLRMKDADESEIRAVAKTIMPLCRRHNAVFVIDDHVRLAIEVGADGVHLGKNDMPVRDARRLASSGFIIGGTANTFEDVVRLHAEGADYIGCGPFRFTTTKKNLAPLLGLEGYRRIMDGMAERGIGLPLVAIGGIGIGDIRGIAETRVAGIALSGSILRADDPAEEMRRVKKVLEQYYEQ